MSRENDYPRWWHLLLLALACAAVIWAVMYCVKHHQPEPAPEVVTVDVENQALYQVGVGVEEPAEPEVSGPMRTPPVDDILDAGRKVYYGEATNYPDKDEALRYYATYKTVTFTTLRGHGGSCFAQWDYAAHFTAYCYDSGREFEMALAIAELESTYGAAYNTWGILDRRFDGHYIEGYCAYLDWHQNDKFGATSNAPSAIYQVYNDHQAWRDNVTELYEGIKGERY